MRSDLAKLTTEQERSGSWKRNQKWGGRVRVVHDPEHLYEDEVGGFRPWSRRRNRDEKSFTDVLSPIRGAIRKNVGRPWDDVYSEFCQVLDRRGVSGYHIWTHLMQYVNVHTYMGVDGNVYNKERYWFGNKMNGEFYVHPYTGILCYAQRKIDESVKAKEVTRIFVNPDGLIYVGSQLKGYGRTPSEFFELLEVGDNPKRKLNPGRKTKAWFHFITMEHEEGDWYPASESMIRTKGYYYHRFKIEPDPLNGNSLIYVWKTRTVYVHYKRSANHKEIARINHVIREYYSD